MDVINNNRLRVSLFDAKRVAGYTRRSCCVRFHKYRSRDHGIPRPETSYVIEAFDWQFMVKWRPDGKRATAQEGADE